MKERLIIVTMLLVFAGGAALAQSYQIRVTWPVRLRASHSLDSAVVAKTRADEVLQVVGRFNRWLKIERDGSTAWLADWVDYTRLDQEAPPAAPASESTANQQQPSDIDNCCFVDRHCQTDGEWADGYWAYQRNECPAPAPPFAPASPTRPRIEGLPSFVRFIESTLDLLEARSTRWYRYVVDQTNLIVEGDPFGPGSCGAHVNVSARRVTVDTDCQTWGIGQMAPILVHEACHVYHHDNGITYPEGKLREEWECGKPPVAARIALGYAGGYHMPWDEYVAWMNTNPFG